MNKTNKCTKHTRENNGEHGIITKKDKKKLNTNREEDCSIGPNEKRKVRNRQQDQDEEKTSREKCADTEIEIEKRGEDLRRKVCRHRK
jgi:hypothetical protein